MRCTSPQGPRRLVAPALERPEGFTWVRRVAEGMGAEIHVAHIVVPQRLRWRWPFHEEGAEVTSPEEAVRQETVDRAQERLDELHLPTRTKLVRHVHAASDAAYGISQLVGRLAPTLMVMTASGSGGGTGRQPGHITLAALRTALVPTLVVKSEV